MLRAALAALALALSAAPVSAYIPGKGELSDETKVAFIAWTKQDYQTAARLYREEAEKGDAFAQDRLGLMYVNGEGVPQDAAEATKWFRMVAEQGYKESQYTLGFTYLNGSGVPQDYVLAHMWFNLAAAQGRGYAKEERDKLSSLMTREQIAEAQRLAREWKPK